MAGSRAIVLGAGRVGAVIAADLARDPDLQVTVVDRCAQALERAAAAAAGRVRTEAADLSRRERIADLVGPHDVVVGALASSIGFQTLEAVIEAGKPVCDISFMPEDALALDAVARSRGVTAVVDCGVAPGLSNAIAGRAAARLDPCRRLRIDVGGVPRNPAWPFYYKAAFAPADVIEQYRRPARVVEGGRQVVREALSGIEPVQIEGVGALEAFYTDGLRSLVHTLDVPDMAEKTLRHPGHAGLMLAFREAGLLGSEPIDVGGASVRPVDVTSTLLFPRWAYGPGEEDLTVLRVVAEGTEAGSPTRLTWVMVDRFDAATGTTSMARTTAFPCAIVVRMLLRGELREPGVVPPEHLGRSEALFDRLLSELAHRGIGVNCRKTALSSFGAR